MKYCWHGLLILFAVGLLWQASPATAQLYANERDGTVVGGNAGWGWAWVEGIADGEEFTTETQDAFTGGLRLGFSRNEYVMIAVDVGGYVNNFVDSRIQLFYLVVEGHWFPGGGGLFVRGGAGYGSLQLTLKTPAIEFPNFTQGGFSWGAGLGYELRVSDSLAIGLAYDYREFNIGSFDIYEDVSAILNQLTFQVQLYFI